MPTTEFLDKLLTRAQQRRQQARDTGDKIRADAQAAIIDALLDQRLTETT